MTQRTPLALCLAMAATLAPAMGNGASALDAAAPAPPVTYRSAFDAYRPFADVEPKSWRALNDTVRDVGGHVGVMKAAGDAAAPPAAGGAKPPSSAATQPAAGGSTAPSGAASRESPPPATKQ